ncbi:hypothetical protein ANCCEY_04073 [Ancylostoma ceylanicum]|uniref:DOMON domain-containing protein n=1 Tax=Ancylostoma ceylanicum TaxID=53326 RepID=A0A0D6M3F9_9BILA|nr:hypothetical protein ANCCEY_04073 [Ancylostoma ceylanicum]
MLPLFLAAFLVSSVAAADCTYSGGDVSARWQVSGDKLTVEFINKKIGNNQWTGIGFGPNMNSSVLFASGEHMILHTQNQYLTVY